MKSLGVGATFGPSAPLDQLKLLLVAQQTHKDGPSMRWRHKFRLALCRHRPSFHAPTAPLLAVADPLIDATIGTGPMHCSLCMFLSLNAPFPSTENRLCAFNEEEKNNL